MGVGAAGLSSSGTAFSEGTRVFLVQKSQTDIHAISRDFLGTGFAQQDKG